MEKKVGFLVGGIIVIFLIVASVLIANNSSNASFNFQAMANRAASVNTDNYELDSIIPADENTGNLPEKIIGKEDSKLLIFEYADYSCSHCAEYSPIVNKIIADYDGKVAVVFRNYLISYFKNNVISACAATAAGVQGYWEPYKNLLYQKQDDWYYMKGTELTDYLGWILTEVSGGQADLDQFYKDLKSEPVAQRVAFEFSLGNHFEDLEGTPYFRINGQAVKMADLRSTVEKLLGEA
jgi:protein-disulfide isomerase